MCVYSMTGDYFTHMLPERHPWTAPAISSPSNWIVVPEVTRAEFDALKREMEELKLLLKAAKRFDEATGQPDCEHDDKVALIKRLADLVGVDMGEVIK